MAGVLRGGSWNNNTENLRAAFRNNNNPDERNNNIGFRLAAPPQHSLWTSRAGFASPRSKLDEFAEYDESFKPESWFLRKPGACLRESRSVTLVQLMERTEDCCTPPVTRSPAQL